MDFDFILAYTPAFVKAAVLTLEIFALGLVFSLIVGFFCVLINYFSAENSKTNSQNFNPNSNQNSLNLNPNQQISSLNSLNLSQISPNLSQKIPIFTRFIRILNSLSKAYIELSRNTPLLIQLFFLYYGLGRLGISLSSFTCAVVGLSFLGGSYMAESLRAGLEAVKRQQFEAGLSLGFTRWQNFRFVILPQALGVAMPSISANTIFLFKETSVVSIIALPDLVQTMTSINSLTYKTDELLFMLFVGYLIIILPLSLGLSRLEKRLSYV